MWSAEGEDKIEASLHEMTVCPSGTDSIEVSKLVEIMESTPVFDHDFANCHCGFYAYTTGAGYYYSTSRVVGIVEGYGETLICKK